MFDQLSIRYKLAILLGLSSTIALLVSLVVVLNATLAAEKDSSLQELAQITDIISENMRAALAFHDANSAANILEALHTNPHILYAVVNNEDGEAFATYQSARLNLTQSYINFDQLQQRTSGILSSSQTSIGAMEQYYHYAIHKIDLNQQAIGSVLLVSDNEAMFKKMNRFTMLIIGSTLFIIFMLSLLSMRLQNIFTQPIYHLIDSMQKIADTKNYQVELKSERTDEFKALYQGFNEMLAQIYARDQKLNQLATTDTLTQLSNRHVALDAIEAMTPRLVRQQQPLGIILLDIDLFKHINDSFGHNAGDEVLKTIASIIKANARPYDVVARWGGEEFLVVCDNAGVNEIQVIAERIRNAIESQPFIFNNEIYKVTSSLGIYAAVPDMDILQMIDNADKALYAAKQSGRNCVKAWA